MDEPKSIVCDRYKFEVIDYLPHGYEIWNIGKNMTDGYLPLCKLSSVQPYPGARNVDIDSLKAIKLDGAQTVLAASIRGQTTVESMEKYLERHKGKKVGTAAYRQVKRIEAALEVLKDVKRFPDSPKKDFEKLMAIAAERHFKENCYAGKWSFDISDVNSFSISYNGESVVVCDNNEIIDAKWGSRIDDIEVYSVLKYVLKHLPHIKLDPMTIRTDDGFSLLGFDGPSLQIADIPGMEDIDYYRAWVTSKPNTVDPAKKDHIVYWDQGNTWCEVLAVFQGVTHEEFVSEMHKKYNHWIQEETMTLEKERSDVVDGMVDNLCQNTDFDLLYAQKKALLSYLHDGIPVPKEALGGLINFLDQVGDLGEALGRFQYDGLEPDSPMQPEYEKREVIFEPEPEQKLYVLCEELEHGDAIRQFSMLAVSYDVEGLKQLLAAKVAQDTYGYIASNGIEYQTPMYLQTGYQNGFVEYYITQAPVRNAEQIREMLTSPDYDTAFRYPDGFRQVVVDVIRKISAAEGFGQLVDAEKAADAIMTDTMFQAELKSSDCCWFSSEYLGNSIHASDHIASFVYNNLAESRDYFIALGAMEKTNYPENLKDILIDSIYDVCRDYHLPVNSVNEMAEDFMRTAIFKERFQFICSQEHIMKETNQHKKVILFCYDFAKEQLAPSKDLSLDQRIAQAEDVKNGQPMSKQNEALQHKFR